MYFFFFLFSMELRINFVNLGIFINLIVSMVLVSEGFNIVIIIMINKIEGKVNMMFMICMIIVFVFFLKYFVISFSIVLKNIVIFIEIIFMVKEILVL